MQQQPEYDGARVRTGRQEERTEADSFNAKYAPLGARRAKDPACTCRLDSPCRTCQGWDAKIRRVARRHAAILAWKPML